MTMTHPGLPAMWGILVGLGVAGLALRHWLAPSTATPVGRHVTLFQRPLIGPVIRALTGNPKVLLAFKILMVALFLLVIAAGLFGTPIPERNIATVLTWNIWWTGLIISIFFLGSAWCAVCPWDALATWLVRRRLWRRAHPNNSLNLRVPRRLRSVWPALLMFIGLTWLELGIGVTTSPYGTALLSLLMVVLATVSLALYENKAFCRYFCPIGRTIGFYSQLAPVELRPIDPEVCAQCTTLECYHGSETVEPCPTHLVMGRLKQNTYCTSCGNCTQSCPDGNVAWRLRPQSIEAVQSARPHSDEAWFMLTLLALTGFHGVTMMPFFEQWVSRFARLIDDSGQLLWSFSTMLVLSISIPVLVYTLFTGATWFLARPKATFKRTFTSLAFSALPLAFAYHLAHNLNHLVRESDGLGALFLNPLGIDTDPLSMAEKHQRHLQILIPEDVLFALQAGLMIFGFWISLKVIRHRGRALIPTTAWQLWPMILFAIAVTGFHLWLLMLPMVMRM